MKRSKNVSRKLDTTPMKRLSNLLTQVAIIYAVVDMFTLIVAVAILPAVLILLSYMFFFIVAAIVALTIWVYSLFVESKRCSQTY